MPGDFPHDRTQDKAVSLAQVAVGRGKTEGQAWAGRVVRFLREGLSECMRRALAHDRNRAASVASLALAGVKALGHLVTGRIVPFLNELPSRLAEHVPRPAALARKADKAVSVAQAAVARAESDGHVWSGRLVVFLRIMAVLAIFAGLYHWAQVTGFVGGEEDGFENQPTAWQAATVYFAVIDLVAGVGLWLATPWGAVVWLSSVVSMAVITLMFPGIFGGSLLVVAGEAAMLAAYLGLAFMAARERQP